MPENEIERNDVPGVADSVVGRGLAVMGGLVLMIVGLAMGVSVVLLPIGIPVGLFGLLLFLAGLFGRQKSPSGG
jgi:hypothetical protein